SQIYTMAGMTSQLHLEADQAGTYLGLSAQFSGAGFPDMRFDVRAVAADDYARWVADTRSAGGGTLDTAVYAQLVKPSQNVKPMTFRAIAPGLFDAIVNQTAAEGPGSQGAPSPRKGS